MMAQRILLLLNIALGLALAWLWLDETGQPRPNNWVAPAPLVSTGAAANAGVSPTASGISNPAQYMAILDRPMFAPDRRPPPPPEPPAPPPPPDPLANFTLYGVYGTGEQGGILIKSDGRVRRIRAGEGLGDWTVQAVQGRQVTLIRADETRTLTLAHVYGARPKTDVPQPIASAGTPSVPLDRQAMQAQAMDEARERLRQRNELFRKAGLPLAKE